MNKQPSNALQVTFAVRCSECRCVVCLDGVSVKTHVVAKDGRCLCHTCAKMLNFSNQPLKLDDEREN